MINHKPSLFRKIRVKSLAVMVNMPLSTTRMAQNTILVNIIHLFINNCLAVMKVGSLPETSFKELNECSFDSQLCCNYNITYWPEIILTSHRKFILLQYFHNLNLLKKFPNNLTCLSGK